MSTSTAATATLSRPLTLRSGLTLDNRLVKASMTESLADRHGNPTTAHQRLYRRWAAGGLGAQITGNAMVDRRFLERARNVVLDGHVDTDALRAWAAASEAIPTIVQLSHAGRQTNRAIAWEPVSASAGKGVNVLGMFGAPRALSTAEVHDVRDRFIAAARRAVDAGFRGVQVHAAHGYLLSQFLSSATNQRTDAYGGSVAGRARLLLEIVDGIHADLGDDASVWVKVNSNDFRAGGLSEDEAAQVVRWLDEAGVDVVELSGGTYENVAFLEAEAPTGREAYFIDFARAVQADVEVPLLLTGGFSDVDGMQAALEDGVALIGLARPLAADPELAGKLLDGSVTTAPRPAPSLPEPLRDASEVGWYRLQMELAARGRGAWHGAPGIVTAADYVLREMVTALVDRPGRLALVRRGRP